MRVDRPGTRRAVIWAGRAVAAAAVVGLVVYLFHVGLDKADKLASGISGVVAVVGLLVPLFLPRPSREAGGVRSFRQDVKDAVVEGDLIQAQGATPAPTAQDTTVQRVARVRVGGDLKQVTGVDGDLHLP